MTSGSRLKEAREKAGLNLDVAAVRVGDTIHRSISRETIRRYEKEETAPEKWDVTVLLALADEYDTTVSEIAPELNEQVEVLADLARTRRYPFGAADLGKQRILPVSFALTN